MTSSATIMSSLAEELDELCRTLDNKNTSVQELQEPSMMEVPSLNAIGGTRNDFLGDDLMSHGIGRKPSQSASSASSSVLSHITPRGDYVQREELHDADRSNFTKSNQRFRKHENREPTGETKKPTQKEASFLKVPASEKHFISSMAEDFISPTTLPPRREVDNNNNNKNNLGKSFDGKSCEQSPMEPPGIQSPEFRFYSPPPNNTTRRNNGTPMETSFSKKLPSPTRPLEWQPILEDIKAVMEQKDKQIHDLEEENAYLRSELERLQEQQNVSTLKPSASQGEENNLHNNKKGPPATQTKSSCAAFSPGTQFVAELASLMEIKKEHQAPLSFIIDRHWDQFSKYNKPHDAKRYANLKHY